MKSLMNLNSLTHLPEENLRHLKNRIGRWQGLVRVFIHPLYEKWRYGDSCEYLSEHCFLQSRNIEHAIIRLLNTDEENVPPIIIFEEHDFVHSLGMWLRESVDKVETTCYYMETQTNNPTIIGHHNNCADAWKEIENTFVNLGVKRILLGGMRLDVSTFETDWTGTSPYVGQCVGIALSYLSNRKGGCLMLKYQR